MCYAFDLWAMVNDDIGCIDVNDNKIDLWHIVLIQSGANYGAINKIRK